MLNDSKTNTKRVKKRKKMLVMAHMGAIFFRFCFCDVMCVCVEFMVNFPILALFCHDYCVREAIFAIWYLIPLKNPQQMPPLFFWICFRMQTFNLQTKLLESVPGIITVCMCILSTISNRFFFFINAMLLTFFTTEICLSD